MRCYFHINKHRHRHTQAQTDKTNTHVHNQIHINNHTDIQDELVHANQQLVGSQCKSVGASYFRTYAFLRSFSGEFVRLSVLLKGVLQLPGLFTETGT